MSADPGKTARTGAWLPALAWLRRYRRSDLRADGVAGLITAVLLVPQAMALGMLAGLPPQVGLYASVAAPIAYALFGSSRTLSVGPVAVAAIMVAEALAAPEVRAQGSALGNAVVLALECGAILLAMAALRLGMLVNFISHPVLAGFTIGAATLILLSQLPPLLGVAAPAALVAHEIVAALLRELHAINWATAALGAGSVLLLALAGGPLQRRLRAGAAGEWALLAARAAPLAVVVAAVLVVAAFDLDRTRAVATVGPIPAGLSLPDAGILRPGPWITLLPSALLIALVSYVESVSIAKIIANRVRERIHPNRELAALGAANVAAALSGGMPVAGSFSRTTVNFAAGARTQMASVVAALAIGATLLLLAPWFARLPNAALAAVIVVAVAPLVDWRAIRTLWHYERSEAAVLLLTLAGVLLLGIEIGLVLGLVTSLVAYIWRSSAPHVAVVGRIPGTEHFRNVARHDVETWPTLALIRVDESLTFVNIGVIEDFIVAHLARHPEVEHVVLVASAINHIDSSALEGLERLIAGLREAGVTVHLAEVKGPVLDALERAGLPARMAPGRVFFRTSEAVEALARAPLRTTG
ncbi:MAG TPA: sulfate permease [Burkholderiales bacterium]